MDWVQALILGIVQGFTEFLPISSSGHLVLAQAILGIEQPGNEFEILVHLGTLASVLLVFFNDIKSLLFSLTSKKSQLFIFFVLVGTLPAICIGLGFKDFLESLFDNMDAVGGALIFTGLILYCSSFIKIRNREHSIVTSILIGCAQTVAIIPGVSRSGMTICTALFLGLSPKEAARFSFLLAIPVISGAGILTALDVSGGFQLSLSVSIVAFLSSFGVGVVALKWLLGWLEQGKFHYFGVYCLSVGFITLMV
jgi:undecaprenyl-diphosphatase